jgi:hypothetical protein
MLLEDQRDIHEDLERLEEAIAERLLDDPKHVRHIRPIKAYKRGLQSPDSRASRARS